MKPLNIVFTLKFLVQKCALYKNITKSVKRLIGQDPTPPQMGGSGGIQASGSIGYMMRIEDPNAPKPQPGMPPVQSGSTVRGKLTSGLDCVASMRINSKNFYHTNLKISNFNKFWLVNHV